MLIQTFTFESEPNTQEIQEWFTTNPSFEIRFIVRYPGGIMIFYTAQ